MESKTGSRVAYASYGRDDAPAVLVLGGISAHRFVAGGTDGTQGWWPGVVGSGTALDPERHRLASIDYLGGAGDSTLAESLGGGESLVCHPATMTHAAMDEEARAVAGIGESLLRLSVGIESASDLVADLRSGLDRVAGSVREPRTNGAARTYAGIPAGVIFGAQQPGPNGDATCP